MKVTKKVYFKTMVKGRTKICKGETESLPEIIKCPNRKTEYMAFAIVFDGWLESGKVKSFEDLAHMVGISYPMLSKIMSYRLKSPKEQAALLLE